ncbi:hypothetical protein BO78DRAFT_392645, partial [Aspergillus sclerotiicarbonarius CBS 121057]
MYPDPPEPMPPNQRTLHLRPSTIPSTMPIGHMKHPSRRHLRRSLFRAEIPDEVTTTTPEKFKL